MLLRSLNDDYEIICSFFVFFFQAEDGIRDTSVTGVQTCALPIFQGPGHVAAPFTPWAQERLKDIKPGNGPRAVTEEFINDPLSIMCDPAGFPRLLLYELRPVQIVQTPTETLMLYMFEKRWRAIWTDVRYLPGN